MTVTEAKAILEKQRAQRAAGMFPTAQEERDFWKAIGIVAQALPFATPRGGRDTRTPAQKLAQLRRDYGDERRNSALWDSLPMLLQKHWAAAKRAAGEALAAEERRALDYSTRELATTRYEVRP
jgi:hypothetical protein